jgi:uncharacterized tellurite resistance protein B-like protein
VLADQTGLQFFSRKLGHEYRRFDTPWQEISALSTEVDGLCKWLVIRISRATLRLRFVSWEDAGLDELKSLWQAASAPLTPADAAGIQADGHQDFETLIGPGVVFAACLIAMARADGELDDREVQLIRDLVGREDWIQAGLRHLEPSGLDPLLTRARGTLRPVQCRCLLGNLLQLGMVDGWLRSSERELIERCRLVLGTEAQVVERIERVSIARHRLAVFSTGTEAVADESRDALVWFFALLQAVFPTPDDRTNAELENLRRSAGDLDAWNRAASLSQAHSLFGLLAEAVRRFDDAQRRCALANLAAIAMADGTLNHEETNAIELVRAGLGVPLADCGEILDVLAETLGTGVFHAPRTSRTAGGR